VRIDLGRAFDQRQQVAAEVDQGVADGAVRVSGGVDAVQVVRQPRPVEQEARFACRRVERELVDEFVDARKARGQARLRFSEVAERRLELRQCGLRLPRKGPDLVGNDRRGLARECLPGLLRGPQRLRERLKRLQRRARDGRGGR
jgi:hypothetical protein